MKIYLASSWRSKKRVDVVDAYLTSQGHECFNFTNPGEGAVLPDGFHWTDVDLNWKDWTPATYRAALAHPIAKAGLKQDHDAMQWADAVVAIQPFGRSASLELGWFIGHGKPAIVILDGGEPELMFGLATLCLDMVAAAVALDEVEERRQTGLLPGEA